MEGILVLWTVEPKLSISSGVQKFCSLHFIYGTGTYALFFNFENAPPPGAGAI